jgi:hypothetical protein
MMHYVPLAQKQAMKKDFSVFILLHCRLIAAGLVVSGQVVTFSYFTQRIICCAKGEKKAQSG